MKAKILIISIVVVVVVICTSLYVFREQPVVSDVQAVRLEFVDVVRVENGVDTDVTQQIDLKELIRTLSETRSKRSIYPMSSYFVADVMWEINFIVEKQGPVHVVLGTEGNNFWYVSADEGQFDIIDPDILINKMDTLYESPLQ